MTCKHAWVVTGIAEIDDELMETQGHLGLTCAKCSAIARLERPTYFECYLVTRGWLRGDNPGFVGDHDDRLVIVLEGARADDLLTAGDDETIDSAGTMGWLETADDWQAHEFDHLDGDAPAECNHTWHVRGVAAEEAADSEIELYCLRCHEWARVPDLTDYECELIGRAWLLGLALEWQDNKRVQLHRDATTGATGHTSLDDPDMPADQPRPPVADLVDLLDLFGGDDDDIPF